MHIMRLTECENFCKFKVEPTKCFIAHYNFQMAPVISQKLYYQTKHSSVLNPLTKY